MTCGTSAPRWGTRGSVALVSVALVSVAIAAARLRAQRPIGGFEGEVGAAVVREPGAAALTAPTLGGAWTWTGARTTLRADGIAALGADAWSGQVAASAAHVVGDPDAPYELDAQGRAAHLPAARATAQLIGGVRRHLTFGGPLRPTSGAWLGAFGGATTGVDGDGAAPVISAEAGAWRALAADTRVVATASWTATRADSAALATAVVSSAAGTTRVRMLDATAAIERAGTRVDLAAVAGARRTALTPGAGGGARWGTLAIGTVTWWARAGVGVVVGAGAQPADPGRGLPAVRHLALTLRLQPRAWSGWSGTTAPTTSAVTRPVAPPPTGSGAVATVDAHRLLHVVAPNAARVRVRAAATGWRAVDLARGPDGVWALAAAWPAGPHRLAVRVDDAAWQPPANLPAVDDEYGGRVGLLVVP